MRNKKILTLIFVVAFLTLLAGCFPPPIEENQAPIITSDPVETAKVGVDYTYDVDATDPDGDSLTYSLIINPTNMLINQFTGVISWKPSSAQVGDNAVEVVVSDGDLSVVQKFTIKVSKPSAPPCPPPVNHAPIITSIPGDTAIVGVKYTYTIKATDQDGDKLTYSFVSGPEGMTFDTPTISWTPDSEQVGPSDVKVKASDGKKSTTQSFTVVVVKNKPPIADAGPDRIVVMKTLVEITFIGTGTDPDGTVVSYSWDFGDGGTGEGVTVGYTYSALDTYTVTLTVTDNTGATGSDIMSLKIFDTIQGGIDAYNPVDLIEVMAGTYNENVVIDEALNLVGTDSATTIIDGGYVGNTVTITASDVTISGFTITGGYADPNYPHGTHALTGTYVYDPFGGVVIDGNDGISALTGITIENNTIHGNDGNGIYVSAATDVAIRNNEVSYNGEFEGSSRAGISLTYRWYEGQFAEDPWEDWRRPKDILVEGNEIHNNHAWGMYLNSGKDCIIRSNKIWGNSNKGLLIASSMPRCEIPSEYNIVELNEIYDNAKNGIKIVSFNHHNTFTGNVIYNNGYGVTAGYFGYGFQFKDGDHNTLQDNVIYGNALGGLYLWGYGDRDYTWYDTTDNTITGNTISDHTGHGIYIPANLNPGWVNSGFRDSNINGNNIMNNLTYGLENADTTQTVNAENNWWGNETGPTHLTNPDGTGDKISDNVDFSPWSTSSY